MEGVGKEAQMEVKIPNLDTMADYIDRLIVEVNKLSWFENQKREEQGKETPDPLRIAMLDNLSRDACELRSQLKNRINALFQEILETSEYRVLREIRTFRPPGRSLADVMADRCHDIGDLFLRGEMARMLEKELRGNG